MANTYSQIYIHVVFSVQGRQSLLSVEWREEVFKYITGIVKNRGQKLLAINGMPDHVHVFIGMSPAVALSDLVRDIKAGSSGFINEKQWLRGKFNWQEGFGAFSHSHREIDAVVRYIRNQQKHHQKKSFKEEYIDFLKLYAVQYDERYLLKWIDDDTHQQDAPDGA